jgi:hypothetical protein
MHKYFFLLISTGTFLMIIVMQQTGASLKTKDTPNGILDLEFANSKPKAVAVIDAWGKTEATDNIKAAKLNTELDFIFLLFYSIFLHQACRSIAGLYKGIISNAGLIVATGAIAAGVLDILENIGMLLTLHGYINSTVTLLTFCCSVTKWLLVLSALVYFLVGGGAYLIRKLIKPVNSQVLK